MIFIVVHFSFFWTWKFIFFSRLSRFLVLTDPFIRSIDKKPNQIYRLNLLYKILHLAPSSVNSQFIYMYINFLDSSLHPLVEPWENPTLLCFQNPFHFVPFSFSSFFRSNCSFLSFILTIIQEVSCIMSIAESFNLFHFHCHHPKLL